MNPKTIFKSSIILILLIILYLLGTRIHVSVGKVREIQEIVETTPPTISPSISSSLIVPAPTEFSETQIGLPGPLGVLTDNMLDEMNKYPHKNPMMYKKPERIFLDNITE